MNTPQSTLLASNLGDALWRNTPEAPALIDLGGEVPPSTYTYRELNTLQQSIARGLLKRGLTTGDRIAILSANRAEYLAIYLGAMSAGMVPVPINTKFPSTTIEYILQDSGAKLLFRDRSHAEPLAIPTIEFASDSSNSFKTFLDPGPFTAITPAEGQPAMFLYTSGSTGIPKGVVLSHQSHLWVLAMRTRPVDSPRLRVLIAAPLYHMNALSTAHAALAQGDSVVLLPRFDVAQYIDTVERYRCNLLTSVPTMFSMMLKRPDLLEHTDLSSVRSLRMGSAPVSPTLFDALRRIFPDAAIANVFGTTEAGPIVFGGEHPDGLKPPPLSLGYRHPQVKLRINGQEHGESQGVLEIKSPAVMSSYHGKPELTRKVFTADGFYRTGDVFRRDRDGFYFYIGREDDMFSCGGENIYPSEIEKMLERHPAVQQVAVVPIPDEIKGAKPVAFVVLRPNATVTERELQEFALANAPAYHHPRRVWFVPELPLAGTNKINKNELIATAIAHIQEKS